MTLIVPNNQQQTEPRFQVFGGTKTFERQSDVKARPPVRVFNEQRGAAVSPPQSHSTLATNLSLLITFDIFYNTLLHGTWVYKKD